MLERRTVDGITFLTSPRLESAGFLVACTERTGGTSAKPYASLNLGLRSGDDPEAVGENRRRVIAALGIEPFACVRQKHGARVVRAGPSRAGGGFLDPDQALGDADGMVTTSRGVALAVLAADCVPVALADPSSGRLAVVHAGWRGVAAGILREALRHFADPAEVRGVVGPAIGPDHYEVGEDVALAVSAATDKGAVTQRVGASLRLDLPASVARILRESGVTKVERAEECTACLPRRFFSHRREGPGTGRQSMIAVRLA
jgi:purine-nucleoside/S-methyl-5'-thioadenosine phosphorylase / adenosine deaminase